MRIGKQGICVLLSAVMAGTLFTGCSQVDDMLENTSQYMDTSETISADSKWVNSDVLGVVTEDTSVSEKDDFAAAVNKDWILSVSDQVNKEKTVSVVGKNEDVIKQQKQDLLNTASSGGTFEENKVGMDSDDYHHMTETFSKIVATAADWDSRNEAGTAPLADYISAISSISSLDQMNDYLCNKNGDFLSGAYLIPFTVAESLDADTNIYTVQLYSTFENSLTLNDQSTALNQDYVMEVVKEVLTSLGYTSSEASKIVKKCWQLETALSEHSSFSEIKDNISSRDEIMKEMNHPYTKEELEELSGNYPIMDILKAYAYDQSDSYTVYEPNYVRSVAKLYKEKNLEKIKAYYIVHTVLYALPLLSRDYYDQYIEYFTESKKNSTDEQILQKFTTTYIPEIFEEMYLTNYCTSEQKEYLENLIQKAITEYESILESEDWLSDVTKEKAIDKLNHITTRVLYPDHLNDCNDLQVDAGNLLDIVAKINAYNLKKEAFRINTEADKKEWNLAALPSTTVNAYYTPLDNTVTILAGITASRELFDINASDEENMAHLGYIIGHEISHAFDSSGYQYDKDGNENKWWTDKDEEAFQKRVSRLANYFSSFKYFRKSDNIRGDQVQEEAIADIGGVKCMLAIAKQMDNFDYQKFFRSFALTWATCRTYSEELKMVEQDSHPLPFLRINITLQQFEEFHEAFDIQPGDGMYLAPENRIAVW